MIEGAPSDPDFITVDQGLEKTLREACAALGGHELTHLLDEMTDGFIILDDRSIRIMRDYVRRIGDYLHAKYPGYTGDEDSDPTEEDQFLDFNEAYRNKLVYKVASAIGDDWLEEKS